MKKSDLPHDPSAAWTLELFRYYYLLRIDEPELRTVFLKKRVEEPGLVGHS